MADADNFDADNSAGTAVLQNGDKLLVHVAASSKKATLTGAQILQGVVTPISLTATTVTLTQATHAGAMLLVNATPQTINLPNATGTGAKYRFQFQTAATATATTIKRGTSTDSFQGFQTVASTSSSEMLCFIATATDNTATFNGTTKGGVLGDFIEFEDVASGFWKVWCHSASTGSYATPFSHT